QRVVQKTVVCVGLELTFYDPAYEAYGDPNHGKFWGGNTPTASWLWQYSIEQWFRLFGYDPTVRDDNRDTHAVRHIIATALPQADGV
ncbi:MAG: hypothetical protein ACREDA_08135, partial [Methylocella sp.]